MGITGTSAGVEGIKPLVVVLVGGALGATDVAEGSTDDVPDDVPGVAVAAGTTGMAEGMIAVCGNT